MVGSLPAEGCALDLGPKNTGPGPLAARRWLWAAGVVALGVLAFLAVRGPFRLLSAAGVVVALLALWRPPRAS